MQLRNLKVPISNLPASGQSRRVIIEGDSGAAFILQIVDSAGKFYDFVNNTFVDGHIPRCNLKGTISGSTFERRVTFPSVVSSATYNVILIADASTDTVISANRQAINKSLTQVVDVIITLEYSTANTSNYTTSPPSANVATTISPTKTGNTTVETTATLVNATTQTGSNGLKVERSPDLATDLVFIKTTTLDGTTSSSTTLLVDSTTDIVPGMVLVSGPNLSGTPFITKVEPNVLISGVEKKRITLSTAQTLNSDGATLTFHAIGSKIIYNSIGLGINAISVTATARKADSKTGLVTHKVTAGGATTGSDATLHLDGTYGIGKTANISLAGIASGVTVSSVSANAGGAASAGTIEMSSAQDLSGEDNAGVGLSATFDTFQQEIELTVGFDITNAGSANRTISLLLDNFITPGAAS